MTASASSISIADEGAIRQSLERGFRAIKIKIGDSGVEKDVATVAAVRRMIGPTSP
jgi:L-alanine-DL-glutamate epimerase-like enolase superfamily enzyme